MRDQGGESLQLLTACGFCMSCVLDDTSKRASLHCCSAKNVMAPSVSTALPNPLFASTMLAITFLGMHYDKHVARLSCATQVLAHMLVNPIKRSAAQALCLVDVVGFLAELPRPWLRHAVSQQHLRLNLLHASFTDL